MAWVTTRKDKKQKGSSGSSLLVVGTAAGDVKAYDTQVGTLKWRRRNCIEGGVTGVAHCAKAAAVYATGASSQVCVLDIETGDMTASFAASKHPISSLALSPDGQQVLVGGSSMALWDVAAQERKAKYAGHTVPVTALSFAPGGAYAVSAAAGERCVAVWPTSAPSTSATPASSSKKSKKSGLQVAACSITTQEPISALGVCAAAGSSGMANGSSNPAHQAFDVAGVSEGGEALVWRCTPSSSSSGGDSEGSAVQAALLARVSIKGAGGNAGEAVMAVRIQSGSAGPVLTVARGTAAKPSFEQVAVPLPAPGAKPATITLAAASGGVLLPSTAPTADGPAADGAAAAGKAKAKHTREDVTVLGADNMGAPALMRTAAVAAAPGAGKKRGADDASEDEDMEEGDEDEELEDAPDGEVPLGERVAALEVQAGLAGAAAGDAADAGAEAGPSGSSKADSLAVLLTQALRANDRVLLERCLATSNTRIINNTVARLVPLDAANFLRAAVERLLSRPARAGQLAPWLKAVLHQHTGYIMAAPGVQAPLAALYQAIDGRVAMYAQLLRLHGRLGLITAHARGAGGADADAAAAGRPAPEVTFRDASDDDDEEGGDDEPEAEDPFALGSDDEGEEGSEGADDSLDGLMDEDDEDGDDWDEDM